MPSLKKILTKKRSIFLVIIGFSIIILSTLFVTMAFLGPGPNEVGQSELRVTSKNLGSLQLLPGEVLSFNTLKTVGQTSSAVVLDTDDITTIKYDIYFEVINNTFKYTTEEEKPELILQVMNEKGELLTDLPGLEHIMTADGTEGFDITTLDYTIPISIDTEISTTQTDKDITQIWTFQIMYIDLDSDQLENNNAEIIANIIFEVQEEANTFPEKIISDNGGESIIDSRGPANLRLAATSTEFYDSLSQEQQEFYSDDFGLYSETTASNETTYFYRGAVENNWVYFADRYWRILGINSDNTVKLIYAGAFAPTEEESIVKLTDNWVGSSVYSTNTTVAEYTGYMYTLGVRDGFSVNSDTKTVVDTWYEGTILSTNYHKYVADTVYCADRTINSNTVNQVTGIGNGIGTDMTVYGPTNFIRHDSYVSKGTINYDCSKNDSFTVDDIVNGNGALTYPVALPTVYDLIAAGLTIEAPNKESYISSNGAFYTMSAATGGTNNTLFLSDLDNKLMNGPSNYSLVVRPVISIKSSAYVIGSGYYNEPYVLAG